LQFEQIELIKMLENPDLLKERIDEAIKILDAKYPWGHVDAIFRPPCVHSRSSACEPNLKEVKKMDVREEYRSRVYATNPFWDKRTIDKIVEHFMMQALEPEEMYELFVNFEEFKKQANNHYAKQYKIDNSYEESYKYYCNYEEFSRSPTLNNAKIEMDWFNQPLAPVNLNNLEYTPNPDETITDLRVTRSDKHVDNIAPFTPFRIEDAQYATPSTLITAHKVGVLNKKRCKNPEEDDPIAKLYLYNTHSNKASIPDDYESKYTTMDPLFEMLFKPNPKP